MRFTLYTDILEVDGNLDQNRKTTDSEIEVTNAQLQMTLMAIREVLHNRGVVLTLAAVGKKDLSLEEIPENLEPALNVTEYASLFAHIISNPRLRPRDDADLTGKSTLQSIGRAYFRQILSQNKNLTGISNAFLFLWGEGKRTRFILDALVNLHKKLFLQSNPALLEKNGVLILNDYYCPYCEGHRAAKAPLCDFTVGLLREAIVWATGEEYTIEETHCRAKGDHSCQFSIARFPTKAASN